MRWSVTLTFNTKYFKRGYITARHKPQDNVTLVRLNGITPVHSICL